MKKNFDTILKAIDGNDLVGPDKVKIDLKTVCVNALLTDTQDRMTGQDKLRRFDLASRLFKGGELEVSPEEIVLIKEMIAVSFGAVVVGPVFHLLDE